MSKKSNTLIIVVIILLLIAGGAYWYLFWYGPGNTITPVVTGNNRPTGFRPFGTSTPIDNGNATTDNTSPDEIPVNNIEPGTPIPKLRLLSNSPVGGYGANTTAQTTFIRWIDRGRGNIYEARKDSGTITTLSNTILPKMYESVWNRNLNAFIGSILDEESLPNTLYAEIKISSARLTTNGQSNASSSQTIRPEIDVTPYELKGKNLPKNMIGYAVSPDGKQIFMLVNESNNGIGYIANFDGTSVKKIFTTPLTKLNVEWPETNTIALTTKGTASEPGFLYFVNPKTGQWKKILGPIFGLSTKVSHDAKYVIFSATGRNQTLVTSIYPIGKNTPVDPMVKTLVDKCAWGNFHKNVVYCATPVDISLATYPDDWYRGSVSFTDKIWQIDATNGEVHLVADIVDESDRLIDAFNLGLDSEDSTLIFMNKNDLSLWSYDLFAK